jgi:hypothetical protein
MVADETTNCSARQWNAEIKRQREEGMLLITVRSSLGGIFPLGELPIAPEAQKLNIISMKGVFSGSY